MEEQLTLHPDNISEANPVADESLTRRSEEGLTARADRQDSHLNNPQTMEATFVLDGKIYHEIKTLSWSSGEAQVLLVERGGEKYVLKLYYPGFVPEEGVLQQVWNMNFELIVHLKDYGKTMVDGVLREYELMEYLQGLSLADYRLNGDLEKMRRIALSAAASLAYLHNCNLIHKDVKLGNYLFRDKENSELVLTDFGISTLIEDSDSPIHKTTQARTPLYAAPEMYDNVIDGEVELTFKADYYSLGIVLFFLWLGKNPFSGNERSMMRMKSEGKLPNLDLLPPEISQLVRGLTVVNPEKRWGYDEVERWYRGETVEVDESSIYLRYKSFVVDSEHNVLAANAKELAALLASRRHLGIKYLYGKVISEWLLQCGNQKMAVELDDIVEKRYPLNPEVGFQAALYTLDSGMPYIDSKGNSCSGIHEVVMSLLSDMDGYKMMLKDENHPLYVYLEMTTELEVERLKEYFRTEEPEIALWRMIFEVDDSIPFLLDKPSSTIDEIVNSFATCSCREDEWRALTDGRLLSWLYYKVSPLLYQDLKDLYDKKVPYTKSQAYRVLFHLKRDVGFDLAEAVNRHQVAALMAARLISVQSFDDERFMEEMEEYIGRESRLVYYADMRGWRDVIMLHRETFNIQAPQHVNRYGVYDIRVAAYRFCMALGYTPEYYLRSNGQLINSLAQYRALESHVRRAEMKDGCLKQWLTIFFHENPFNAFEEKYSYEIALQEYLQEVILADPDDIYAKRFKYASEESRTMLAESRNNSLKIRLRERFSNMLFLSISALLCLLLIVFGYSNPALFIQLCPYSVGIPAGFVLALIALSWSYFHGNGVLSSAFYFCFGASMGCVPVWVLRQIGPDSPVLLVVASLLMVLLGVGCAWWMGRNKSLYKYNDLKPLFQQNIHSVLLDPLYYAYKQRSMQFKGAGYKALEDAVSVMNATKVDYLVHYILWIVFMGQFVLMILCFHTNLLDLGIPDVQVIGRTLESVFEQLKQSDI